jgi:hypothetical protein
MRATLTFGVALLTGLALLVSAPAARAADDDVPSFKKRDKDKEKEFVTDVGTVILKAARSGPAKIELDTYKLKDVKDKKDRKDLEITMNWQGGITKKKFVSTIVVQIDTSNDKEWEVINIDYKDDNKVSLAKPNATKIQELIKKFNR